MNIGISSACFYPNLIEDSIDTIASLGFKNIEIFINTEYEFSKEYANILKEKLDYYNIKPTSIHSYTAAFEGLLFFSDYARRTEDSFVRYKDFFEFSNFLGAKYFTFHGARKLDATFTDGFEKRLVDTYKRLCLLASDNNVSLCQENVSYCKSADYEHLEFLYDKVPELLYTLDIKQAKRASKDYLTYMDIMGKRLSNIHINDYSSEHFCLLPSYGSVDYVQFFKKLKCINYSGDLLIEVYPNNYQNLEQIKKSKIFLEEHKHIG